ncbi:MAG: aminopeptidase P family protein [Gemmatimonadota bacterium]|nr:MAG: aminopeptidase P family protein [Gemmatimonadota bacterium]
MRRREFLRLAGPSAALLVAGHRADAAEGPRRARTLIAGQGVDPLPLQAYRERWDRALRMMSDQGLAALFCEPATNFEYLVGTSFGRSERLIALVIPAGGTPFIVAPEFEVERVGRALETVSDIRGWAEHEDPFQLVADTLLASGRGRIGIEPTTRFGMVTRLHQALPSWELVDATPLFDQLRMIKSGDELALIRRAISNTDTAIAATFASLEAGVTDREVARYLRDHMRRRGAQGGGLVQFGSNTAVPHGGTEERRLERGMPVLIDAGCRVRGYRSDITRMHFFGDDPSPQYREIHNTVLAAQRAASQAGRPGVECQQLDRVARNIIGAAGYGDYFTHRLGHGLGMDGHEPPYLVEGNSRQLEPGMVFTVEPGIYLPGLWGVRIEDDFVVDQDGLQPLSSPVSPI